MVTDIFNWTQSDNKLKKSWNIDARTLLFRVWYICPFISDILEIIDMATATFVGPDRPECVNYFGNA